jgi:ribosome maturation factor RimP
MERYLLEVSSPGLDRPLVKEADFVRFVGKIASVATREPIEGRRNYKGLLKGMDEGHVVMEIDQKIYRVPLALIERANLVY